MQVQDIDVVTYFLPARKSQGLVCCRIDCMQPVPAERIFLQREEAEGAVLRPFNPDLFGVRRS
jgi:hypothetical protein